jgi:hypothetical protein
MVELVLPGAIDHVNECPFKGTNRQRKACATHILAEVADLESEVGIGIDRLGLGETLAVRHTCAGKSSALRGSESDSPFREPRQALKV